MKKILEKIVHTVIPHEKNGNVPHILRAEAILVLVVLAGSLFYFNQNNFEIIKKLNLTATVYPAVLADLANNDRLNSGASELTWSPTLEKAAKLKAEDMAANGYFAHTSPTGVTPWYWLRQADYNFVYAGENLAIDFTESENVERAWINSPTHKENIMSQNFTEIGIATVDGIYNGRNTTFVVEFFGKPVQVAKAKEPVEVKEVATVSKEEKEVVDSKVAGASVENIVENDIKKVEDKTEVKIIEETDKFIVAKNENVTEEVTPVVTSTLPQNKSESISTWYDRFIVNPTNTIKYIYVTILGLIIIAISLMLTKEYQEHHKKHITMGFALMFVVIVLLCFVSTSTDASSLLL